ncbi:hypothetical protein MRB53_038068 [Persea americana]|nr:hypothetical protein MRB53_038068 [Persea americana]
MPTKQATTAPSLQLLTRIFFAVEASKVAGLTWWCYVASNSHFWGDNWNGEDLSIYSAEDRQLPVSGYASNNNSKPSLDRNNPSYSESSSEANAPATPGSIKKTLSVDEMVPSTRLSLTSADPDVKAGFRGAEAYVRAAPIAVHGAIESYSFDLRHCTFTLALTAASSTPQDFPTEVFLPEYHFPQSGQRTSVEVSGGRWEIRVVEDVPRARHSRFSDGGMARVNRNVQSRA